MNFIQKWLAMHNTTPQAALLKMIVEMPIKGLTDKNIAAAYAIFCAVEAQSLREPDGISEHHENAVLDLAECPPAKLRDVVEIARAFADHCDDCNSGDGHPEGTVAKRFYAFKNAIEARRRAEPESDQTEVDIFES